MRARRRRRSTTARWVRWLRFTASSSAVARAANSKIEDPPKAKAKWLVKGIAAGKGSPVLNDGRLYVADDGANLHMLDAETGKRITPGRRSCVGTMLSFESGFR